MLNAYAIAIYMITLQICLKVSHDPFQDPTTIYVTISVYGDSGIAEDIRDLRRIPNRAREKILFYWSD